MPFNLSAHMGRAFACACLLLASGSFAAVSDIEIVGVTPAAFSVVWFSDEPVLSTSVRVFNDQAGNSEITAGLVIVSDSAEVVGALDYGLAKVSVFGLEPSQRVFVQTVTQTAGGDVLAPALGALNEVVTRVLTTPVAPAGNAIMNDIIMTQVLNPVSSEPLNGGIVFAELVDGGAATSSRVAAIGGVSGIGDEQDAPVNLSILLNFNNLFDAATGQSLAAPVGSVVRVVEYRGLSCPDVENQRTTRFGRVPDHDEMPSITEAENLAECFLADRLCDDQVDALDVQFVLNAFNTQLGNCAYNPYLDIVPDDAVNALDVQAVLNRFGEQAPFAP